MDGKFMNNKHACVTNELLFSFVLAFGRKLIILSFVVGIYVHKFINL